MIFLKKVTSIACILIAMTTQKIFPTFIFSGTYSAPGTLRPEMLDTHETHHTKDHFYCGVYDGHVTPNAAHYIAQTLYANILNDDNFSQNPEAALFNGFIKTHEGYQDQEESGATAGVILIKDKIVYAANAGDVKTVLYTFDEQILRPNVLSQDHIIEKEFDRLKKLISIEKDLMTLSPLLTNGVIKQLTFDEKIKEFLVQSVYLVKSNPDGSGNLIKPSRALCNHHFAPYLIPDPFISRFELTNSAQCVVLASKNLWLVIEPEAVGNLIRTFLIQAHEKFQTNELTDEIAQYIAQKLVEKAFSIQDIGNQTVTVILFDTIHIEMDRQ